MLPYIAKRLYRCDQIKNFGWLAWVIRWGQGHYKSPGFNVASTENFLKKQKKVTGYVANKEGGSSWMEKKNK